MAILNNVLTLLLFSLLSCLPLLNASSPGDPNSNNDYQISQSDSVHMGISRDLLSTFTLMSQFAAAAYCKGNNESPATKLDCPNTNNCPLVSIANAATISEFEDTPHFDDTGYIAIDTTHELVVLAIRGSVSKQNWQADFDMLRTDSDLCDDCSVHRGFKHSWDEIKRPVIENMKKAVAENPAYRIVIVGHSLGGAVATLAAADLRNIDDHFRAETELYTFGSPRVANKELADFLTGQSRFSWRITHDNDVVPHLPPKILGYHHVEPEYWIPHHGAGAADMVWAKREEDDWGNGKPVVLSRTAHGRYLGDIGACSDKPVGEVAGDEEAD